MLNNILGNNNTELLNELPQAPEAMREAMEIIKNPPTAIQRFCEFMQKYPDIANQTIQISNCSLYAFRHQITTIDKAINALGIMRAKNIIIVLTLKPLMTIQSVPDLWQHSLRCAVAFKVLSRDYQMINPEDAFIIGFLHDIGKIVLGNQYPIKYAKARYLATQGNEKLINVENAQFSTNHCEIGAQITQNWQLPTILSNCVQNHHTPLRSSLVDICGLLYCADRLSQTKIPTPILENDVMKKMGFQIKDPLAIRDNLNAKSDMLLKIFN